MALSAATPAEFPEKVGKTFVKFYYNLLQNEPQKLHLMYEESIKLSLPDANGVMLSVTTTKAINDLFLSCDYYKGCKVNFETVDSQPSQNGGISILVTGCLTGPEMIKRKFCQTFFLASKRDEEEYIILNDMFIFVDEAHPKQLNKDLKEAVVSVQDYQGGGTSTQPWVGVLENDEEVHCTSEMGSAMGEQKLSSVPASKTYESIVSGRTLPLPVHVTEPEKPLGVSTNPSSDVGGQMTESEKPLGISTNPSFDVGGHSVYVCNLPHNATVTLLEREFTKFGRITPGGVQVKWNPTKSNCYGFVEFAEKKSMQDALMASPVTVAGRHVIIEKKKSPVRVRNGIVIRGRINQFPPRSYMRNEIFRGNGGFLHNFSPERGNFSAPGRFPGFSPHGFQNQMQPRFFHNGDVRMGQRGFFQNGKERVGKERHFQNGDGMVRGPRRM